MVYGKMHYHRKNYFKGRVSESVKNQVHTKDYMALTESLLIFQSPPHRLTYEGDETAQNYALSYMETLRSYSYPHV